MIIQCEKCQTKFRLDDSRITEKGVKVRCAKCKHVFMVKREEPEAVFFETEEPAAAQNDTAAAAFEENSFAAEPALNSAPDDAIQFGDAPVADASADYSSFETSSFDASSVSFDSDNLDVTGTENVQERSAEPVAGGEVDFSSFDFGDSAPEPDQAPPSNLSLEDFSDDAAESIPQAPRKEASQGLDFSDDDMFGAVVEAAPEPSNDAITFDFGEDSFAESMDTGSHDSGGKSGSLFSLDAPADAPFNLGEIDFGDELTSVAVQQVNPDDLKPSQELLFAPLAEAQVQEQDTAADNEITRSFIGDDSSAAQQDLPPLSIASRRKQSPLFSGVIAVVAVLVVSVLGYLGYSSFSAPNGSAPQESGKISVRGVKAAFIQNDEVGELLVVSGEALNEYSKPRAALQVKVTVFDSAGQTIATKSAYGGNPLTDEQLESLSLDKIEAAMANQFGDSLANMEVAPGKAIPFVVVLANLPKGAKDYGVQPAGSTVATGKQ
ncbi:MAG: hypothetical protein A2076_14560 [Geobacteraceae bacterium GWC2_53_11]|nr:MAG: hypothetical protein A2076_14560 [Geobacteraceae bacterium GWC2_53_11]